MNTNEERISKWDVFWAKFDAVFCYVGVGVFLTSLVVFDVTYYMVTLTCAVIIAWMTIYVTKESRQTLSKFKSQAQKE